jgi:hypothetical protein
MATDPAPLGPSSSFELDKSITLGNTSLTLEVTASSDHDVFDAILHDQPFPERSDGKIPLADVNLKEQAGKSLSLGSSGATVTFSAAAGFQTGLGVFNSVADAIDSIQLQDAPELDLKVSGDATDKFLVMMWGYNLQGSVSGSHPIGALGSVTFGAEGARDAKYAVIHRFPKATGAFRAIDDTVKSWRLPRQIAKATDLKPGTWLMADVDGSLAINLAAQLGYDFNLVHEAQLLGMTRQLGAKIDAGLKVTFGLEVSGQYFLVVGRECLQETDRDAGIVHLQLFKQAKRGLTFGLNFSLGVTGQNDVPSADELVKAVFGIQGAQVVRDLHLLRDWTAPNKDLGQSVVRLLNDDGLKLLTKATGIDAKAEFEKARQLVLSEFAKWDALPERVAATTWKLLGKVTGNVDFQTFLAGLADPNPDTRAKTLADALQNAVFGDDPKEQWLSSLGEHGLLALSSELDKVQPVAAKTLDILNGKIIKNIQDFINQKLDLTDIRKAISQNDFDTLDGWLLKRLGDFFNKDLHFEDLKQVQAAINTVFTKVDAIQSKVQQALNSRYSLDVAAIYAKNTTDRALLDASFDMNDKFVAEMFKNIVTTGRLDDILTHQMTGVLLKTATLSHEINRTSTVQINMPLFSFDSTHVNDSLATLTAGATAGTVMVELKASDLDMLKNRYRSELSVLSRLTVKDNQLQMVPDDTQSITYELRQAKKKMSLIGFEHQVTPLLENYLPNLVPSNQVTTFYTDLDRTVENKLHNGTNEFGDVGILLQVSTPAAALGAWFIRRDPVRLKRDKMAMSLRIQSSLRKLLPFYFLQEDSKLTQNTVVAPLLVWAAMPVSTSISFDVQSGTIKQFNHDTDVFWDWPSVDLRRAVARDSHTAHSLIESLLRYQKRLQEAGDSDAQFFGASSVSSWQEMSLSSDGDIRLQSLLFAESQMIRGAADALDDVNNMLNDLGRAPTRAIKRFADFGADFTQAFHDRLSSVYGDDSLRALSSVLLIGASRAIAPELSVGSSSALLSILTLTNNHTFALDAFLSGEMPPKDQVALAQTLVNTTST